MEKQKFQIFIQETSYIQYNYKINQKHTILKHLNLLSEAVHSETSSQISSKNGKVNIKRNPRPKAEKSSAYELTATTSRHQSYDQVENETRTK